MHTVATPLAGVPYHTKSSGEPVWEMEHGTWEMEHGTWEMEHGTPARGVATDFIYNFSSYYSYIAYWQSDMVGFIM